MSTNDKINEPTIRVKVTKITTTKTDNSEEEDNSAECKRITDILTNQQNFSRRAEVGAVVRIKTDMLFDK